MFEEPVETAMASTYMGVQSHGFGGTQVHVIAYCHHYSTRIDEDLLMEIEVHRGFSCIFIPFDATLVAFCGRS